MATVACCVAFFASSAAADTTGPGAPSAGDPYFPSYGDGGYHVSHYDLRLRYQPSDDHLQGTATLVTRPTQNLTAFSLDFALTPHSILVNGEPARFERHGSKVTVTPSRTLPQGSPATFVVDYDGVPSSVQIAGLKPWTRTSDGALAVGEPEIAAWWFPSNDHPRDKATFAVSVAVPDGTQVLSNGVNTRTSSTAGWTTWDWRSTKPTATYLEFLGIGRYEIGTKTGAFGQPLITGYSGRLGADAGAARASVERTPEVLRFLSGLFGPYPFEAQGGVVTAEGRDFALENQTRPTYTHKFFTNGPNASVVVHENAHQWFGDSVSVDTWRDIWLNEGFATYAEWLWSQAQGTGTAQQLFDHYYSSTPANSPFWQVRPGDPGPRNVFDPAVYLRGAMTLHALRNVVGDQVLSDVARTWASRKRYVTGTIEDFIALTEQRSGKRLHDFFNAWLFTPGKPAPGAATGIPVTGPHAAVAVPASVAEIDATHALLQGH
jgi:aminopeptidase N